MADQRVPEGVRAWIVREMQGRRLKVEGPVVPRDPETNVREATVIAISDLPAIEAKARAELVERLKTVEAERDHIAAEALAMAEELEGQPLKRRFRSIEEIKREFFPALLAAEQKAARAVQGPSELKEEGER